jgi:hypothetical protein
MKNAPRGASLLGSWRNGGIHIIRHTSTTETTLAAFLQLVTRIDTRKPKRGTEREIQYVAAKPIETYEGEQNHKRKRQIGP